MSATLLGAITTLFQGNTSLAAALPNSPWLDEPVEGTALPYAVVTEVKEETGLLDFERENEVKSEWTFRVYAIGEAAAEALATKIDQAFDWSDTAVSPLAVSNRTLLSVTRIAYRVKLDRTRHTDTRRVTEVEISYRALWEEVVP